GRGAAFVPKKGRQREHVQLLGQSQARPWTARTHRTLEESDRDARGGREDRAGLILWRSKVIAHSHRFSVSSKRPRSTRSQSFLRSAVCSNRKRKAAVATIMAARLRATSAADTNSIIARWISNAASTAWPRKLSESSTIRTAQ